MLYDKRWNNKTKTEAWPQVLLDAADLIEHDGWTQNDWGDPWRGYCALGAVHFVGTGSAEEPDCATNLQRAAERHLANQIENLDITDWNDRAGRTKEEVIAALRKAALS
jgi:hypothetical protein